MKLAYFCWCFSFMFSLWAGTWGVPLHFYDGYFSFVRTLS